MAFCWEESNFFLLRKAKVLDFALFFTRQRTKYCHQKLTYPPPFPHPDDFLRRTTLTFEQLPHNCGHEKEAPHVLRACYIAGVVPIRFFKSLFPQSLFVVLRSVSYRSVRHDPYYGIFGGDFASRFWPYFRTKLYNLTRLTCKLKFDGASIDLSCGSKMIHSHDDSVLRSPKHKTFGRADACKLTAFLRQVRMWPPCSRMTSDQ